MTLRFPKWIAVMSAVAGAFLMIAPDFADAKLSKGGGAGSRGSRTDAAPPVTQTAPRTSSPINNAAPRTGAPGSMAAAPAAAAANATKPGLFGSMSKGGFMAGLIGAGLFGALLGYGLSGGLGGFGAIIGLMLQLLLVAGVAMLLFSWWQRRKQQNEPAAAYSGGPGYGQPHAAQGDIHGQPQQTARSGSALGGMGLGAAGGAAVGGAAAGGAAASGMFGGPSAAQQAAPVQTRPLTLSGEDFSSFERLLVDIHGAFAREDQTALRELCTEEMADYFTQDIAANVRENRAVRLNDVRLEQGDLSEAWKEPGAEYATVAMRFSLTEENLDRRTQQVVSGSAHDRVSITEIWTFVRLPGGRPQDWRLSAVQDAG